MFDSVRRALSVFSECFSLSWECATVHWRVFRGHAMHALCCLVWNWCACLARWLLLKLEPACCQESQMQLRVQHLWWRNRLNNVLNISTVRMRRDAVVTMLTGTRPREFYIWNVFLPVLYQYWRRNSFCYDNILRLGNLSEVVGTFGGLLWMR